MRKLIIVAVGLIVAWGWFASPSAPHSEQLAALVDAPPRLSGLALNRPPRQLALEEERVIGIEGHSLRLRAEFGLVARVLGRRDYRWDRWSALSPVDLALGWGPMSDPEVLAAIDIRQNGRFYFWRVDQFPIPRAQIEASSANMHLIPASPAVFDRLDEIEEGDRLRLMGYLVDVDRDDGAWWRTSLRRDDTGEGACELILLTSVERL